MVGVLCVAASVAGAEPTASRGLVPAAAFGVWRTMLITRPDAMPRARALAYSVRRDAYMAVDFVAPLCTHEVSFVTPLNRPAERSLAIPLQYAFRVDQNRVYRFNGKTELTMGDLAAQLSVISTPALADVINEMKYGQVLRIEFAAVQSRTGPGYMTYPLAGFAQAVSRAIDMCRKASANVL